jgi:hypothetical protein
MEEVERPGNGRRWQDLDQVTKLPEAELKRIGGGKRERMGVETSPLGSGLPNQHFLLNSSLDLGSHGKDGFV